MRTLTDHIVSGDQAVQLQIEVQDEPGAGGANHGTNIRVMLSPEGEVTFGGRMKTKATERAVVVTTAHKGIFFGYATNTQGTTIRLRAARLCISWSADLRGFMGLASVGPNANCRIGPAADIELRDITSVVEVTREAEEKWNKGFWA